MLSAEFTPVEIKEYKWQGGKKPHNLEAKEIELVDGLAFGMNQSSSAVAVVALPQLFTPPGWVLLHFGRQRMMSCCKEEMGC